MADHTSDRLVLDVYRTTAIGSSLAVSLAQLDSNDRGIGYRLAGPKHYNQATTPLLTQELTERDAAEVRAMLDAVFPVPARVIEDWRELETLPVGTIGTVGEGVPAQRMRDGWHVLGEHEEIRSHADELIETYGPVTILRVGGEQR